MGKRRHLFKPATVISCGVFRSALEHLGLGRIYPHLAVTYLPSNLHSRPDLLKDLLMRAIDAAQQRREEVICLYGDCFPDICDCCQERSAIKVPGAHCYEMLLGNEQFKRIMDETAGTYFLEQELIRDFDNVCAKPLELYDDDMREYFFRHYRRVVYVRQPSDGDVLAAAHEVAAFLNLSLEVRDADYSHLARMLRQLLRGVAPSRAVPGNH